MRPLLLLIPLLGCGARLGDPALGDAGGDGRAVDGARPIDAAIDATACAGGTAAAVEPVSGACYLYLATPRSRDDARTACVALGARLATVRTAAQQATITALIGTATAFLGATDEVTEGTYLWPDGSGLSFTAWRAGEPNNGNGAYEEDCLVAVGASAGGWDDRPCGPPVAGVYASVCQR
jgi:hypothetical protein